MDPWRRLVRAFRVLRYRSDLAKEVREEVDLYLELREEELIRSGLGVEEARRAARAAFGDRRRIEAQVVRLRARGRRRVERRELMGAVMGDLRHSARALARRPGFTAMVVLTLALGIGGNVAIFSVVNGVLLRPLPYPAPERLVQVYETNARSSDRSASPRNFLDARERAGSFSQLTGYRLYSRNLLGAGEPERLVAANVSANFFETFGAPLFVGRTFDSAPARPGEARSVVLSEGLWARRFGSDPGVVGATLRLDDETVTVAGVMRADFAFPAGAQIWIKAYRDVPEMGTDFSDDHTVVRDAWYFDVVGRLRDGVPIERAQSELDGIAAGIRTVDPESNADTGFRIVPLQAELVQSSRTFLLVLFGAVGFVLLIACTNVANLVLARSASREREIGIRAALGAGRGGLSRLLLTESVLLGAAGGLLGVVLAMVGLELLLQAAPATLPRVEEVRLDGAALAFAAGLVLLTVMLFGLLPALRSARTDPHATLTGRGLGDASRGAGRTQRGLVIVQTALAVVLVVGAGLSVRSLAEMAAVELGFETEGLALLSYMLPAAREMEDAEWLATYGDIESRVAAVPGVEAVGSATRGPVRTGWLAGLRVEGRAYDSNDPPVVAWQVVTPGYFGATGIEIVAGRGFDESDRPESPPVAVINETFARTVFPGEDPLGRRINTGLDDGPWNWVTVVGIAEDTRNRGPGLPVVAAYFRPMGQPSAFSGDGVTMSIRTRGSPRDLIPAVQAAAWSVNPDLPFYSATVEYEIGAGFTAGARFLVILLGSFGAVALLLGALGIYGVTSCAVGSRTREMGVRIALGAEGSTLLRLVLRDSLALAAAGLVLGVGAGLALTRLMRALLFEVSPSDPSTFLVTPVLVLVVAGLAALIPARRAAAADPMAAIRAE